MPKASDKEGPTGSGKSKIKSLMGLKTFLKYYLFKRGKDKEQLPTEASEPNPTSLIHDSEDEIVNNIDSFSEKAVEDVMVPRSDIISVSHDATLEELSDLIVKHSHTRTLIYKERLDNIIGFIHIKDLFEVIANSKKFILKKLIRKHIISPHSMKLIDLLAQMQVNRTHIAVVVDEYGGTDGIVTIEDIMEEIVGRIDDEHDIDEDIDSYKILRPGLLVASARVEIEELENVIGVTLKSEHDEFDTIGGLVMAKVGNVPEKGDVIDLDDGVIVEIIESTPRTIKQMKITYIAR
ncbi:MAG: hemolysin family protein [Pseudomonadota bacterium]